jgi:hypothetical protein
MPSPAQLGNYAPVDYHLKKLNNSEHVSENHDSPENFAFIRAANGRAVPTARLAQPLVPSTASPYAVSWLYSADGFFHGTRRMDGRRRTESVERRDCPYRQCATLAGSRQAPYPASNRRAFLA